MSWQTVLAPAGEPGQPLVVSGTVFAADGARPAGGVLDDPLLVEAERRRFGGTGRFSPICRTRRDPAGTLHCTRDIRLPVR